MKFTKLAVAALVLSVSAFSTFAHAADQTLCVLESSIALNSADHYTYEIGIGPDGATPNRVIAVNAQVGEMFRTAIAQTEKDIKTLPADAPHPSDNSQLCMTVVPGKGTLRATEAWIKPI